MMQIGEARCATFAMNHKMELCHTVTASVAVAPCGFCRIWCMEVPIRIAVQMMTHIHVQGTHLVPLLVLRLMSLAAHLVTLQGQVGEVQGLRVPLISVRMRTLESPVKLLVPFVESGRNLGPGVLIKLTGATV